MVGRSNKENSMIENIPWLTYTGLWFTNEITLAMLQDVAKSDNLVWREIPDTSLVFIGYNNSRVCPINECYYTIAEEGQFQTGFISGTFDLDQRVPKELSYVMEILPIGYGEVLLMWQTIL